ncbi:YbhN family protein [Comamonadaceae bacterium PP-2]
MPPQAPTVTAAESASRRNGARQPSADAGPSSLAGRWKALQARPWWPWLIRTLAGLFMLLVVALLVRQARGVDWAAVWQAFTDLPTLALAGGALACAASHLIYGTFDLFGRRYTRHALSVPRTMGITLVAYPFTLNLGSIIGGVSVRYRLYSQRGVSVGKIGQIVGLSIVTNWLGYFVLAGAVFWAWSPQLPEQWHVGPEALRLIGGVLAGLTLAYVVLCAWRKGEPLAVRGRTFPMPSWQAAVLQTTVSVVNWMTMGAAIWLLTQQQAPYAATLAVVLLGAMAGLISRIPAGLGVLEAVGATVLSAYMPAPAALAAVLAYRAMYFFAPLLLAGLAFAWMEWRGRH